MKDTHTHIHTPLVAPYCASYRETISAIPPISEVSKGVGGRGLATNRHPKNSQKTFSRSVPRSPKGHRKEGAEKRPLGRISSRQPPLSANPFSKLVTSLRAMGFLVSQHGQLGAIPPPPFLSVSPLESICEVWRCDAPPSKGVSQRYWRNTL